MIQTGLDRLLAEPARLAGRSYGLLGHQASLSSTFELAHVALSRCGVPPQRLFAPEHGFYGAEQDMVAADERRDPLTGIAIVSLYGDDEQSLRPRAEAFEGIDLLVIDLQDVGSRYYTFAATAIWSAEVAIRTGVEVWILDRPNPLGGEVVVGGRVAPGFESFVSAFDLPIRHGLTLAELFALEAKRRDWPAEAVTTWSIEGWRRQDTALDWQRPWVAPSPNLPTAASAFVYPGLCWIEGTEVSEGRGTTRPFQLIGAPWIDAGRLVDELRAVALAGVALMPTFFRPQFQKHAGELCAGVEIAITEGPVVDSLRLGAEILAALRRLWPEEFAWRTRAYEFVDDVPAIDLLAGSSELREAVDAGRPVDEWLAGFEPIDRAFREERREILLYP